MRIALVHDQLQEFGGAERVFLALKKIYPESDIFTAFTNEKTLAKNAPDWKKWNIKTSWASKIPFFGKLYSPLRFLAPSIWESFDFSAYDLVISSSGWYMCKGIKTSKPTIHISYIHHPPRYLYGYETAVEWQKYWIVKIYALFVNFFLKKWDVESTKRPDFLIANSEETKRRIKKLYGRDSTVIYPPVDIHTGIGADRSNNLKNREYFVTVARLAKAKHIDLLIEVANEHKLNLKVVGNGRELEFLKSLAGPTVEFVTDANDEKRDEYIANAKAFLFASVDEEFGIAPVEAMGFGTPVIAFNSGGLKETVKPGKNGYLFQYLTTESLWAEIETLQKLSEKEYTKMRENARTEAEKYSTKRFENEMKSFIDSHLH